jgi:anti-sigma B factor antagonist
MLLAGREIEALVKAGNNRIIWDLSGVTYISSTWHDGPGGLPSLVMALVATKNSGGELVLVGLTPKILEVLQITKLLHLYTTFATMREALAYFGVDENSQTAS